MASYTGTTGNDTVTGTADADTFNMDAGKDVVRSGAGNDTIMLGPGDDWANGEIGDDVLHGEDGNDTLTGDAGNDTIYGGAGNDGVYGGGNNDLVYGGDGNDNLNGDGANDVVFGEAGDDKVNGGTGDDRLDGGFGNDAIDGGSGNDTIVVRAGEGVDTINGGQGVDAIELRLTSADLTPALRTDLRGLVTWMDGNLAAAGGSMTTLASAATGATFTVGALGVTVSTIETINVYLDGNPVPLADILNRAPSVLPEQMLAGSEDTVISGGVGASDPDGDALSYVIASGPAHGAIALDPATGLFTYTPDANWSGNDSFSVVVADPLGLSATQTVSLSVAATADVPSLAVVTPVIVPAGEIKLGLGSDDHLAGGAGSDFLHGGDGNDVVDGGAAVAIKTQLDITAALGDLDGSELLSVTLSNLPAGSVLSAGAANADGSWTVGADDLAGLTLSATVDRAFSISVTATASEASGSTASAAATIDVVLGRDTLIGGKGSDTVLGGAADDALYGGNRPGGTPSLPRAPTAADNDVVRGGDGNDMVYGNHGDDELFGDAGNDKLYGGKGNDLVDGGDGDDLLHGNSGEDTLRDGAGNDIVSGHSGNDLMVAGEGDDSYSGGSGFDTLDFSAALGGVNIDISKKVASGMGNDKFSSVESFVGSVHDDTFKGSSAVDTIDGGAGNDLIRGLGGADVLSGGEGADHFFWEKLDVSASKGFDRITDFEVGDVLDFTKLVSVGSKPIDDFVRVTDTSAGSLVTVKLGGAMVTVALLEDVHGATAASLAQDGQLLLG
ncbi:MAG TPA: Ig-like domain-containing protein [Hyphomicrobiaceae bacterium]|nr:Ig-like domain-containing protein [Hyphomicrobiaceae bacterium]